ncbi:MAG: HAMP domain-containing histidine kinase [Luteococcus sp.]|uniref:sensor histidine kinase n=1 Tax=Luteococcus sp. TaxID=1969402 RepID=UPI0026492A1D|nr:HAMP domain-containing sensor histidine kinase [Luteococcus sp.]MDN5564980.1 HAMP domain-containing histidine kinase [Luteococcus sp.]
MRRLSTRLVLSHLAVALVATLTTWAVVRWWAPALFDRSLHAGPGAGMGRGMGGGLRSQFADAVNRSVLVGGLVGVLVAGALAVLLSRRITRPLLQLGRTARAMADGDYRAGVPASSTTEIARLAGDVQSLGAQLADTEARRVRLLGEFAHELRTPLTVATGYLEGMADGIVPADPGHLTLVQDELRRVTRLGADLSSLSRAEEGRLEITPVPCRLDELAAAVAERLRPQADDAGIRLVVDAAPTMVTADPDRLAQVLTNLVGNALRATPAGGRITVVCRPGDAGGAVLSVTDTGAGLSAEELGRIFERFYRAPGAPAGGTGIGLTIARGLVEAHGGTLTAGSGGPGQGATFSVSLP